MASNRFTEWPPILEVLAYYGASPPHRGGWASFRCPFHEDAHASAAVNVDLNIFYCHGCQLSVTGLGLIMRQEGFDKHAARRFAEEQFAGGDIRVRGTGGRSRSVLGESGDSSLGGNGLQAGGRHRTLFG